MNGNLSSAARRPVFGRAGEDFLALAAGLGLGAGLMYLCDPNRGRSRRSRLMDEAGGLLHRGARELEKRGKDLLNRGYGFGVRLAEELVSEEKPPSDAVLLERIRSRMGHIVSNPHEVQVRVENGAVTLDGRLSHPERRRLEEEVRAMQGVRRLKTHFSRWPDFNPALLIGIGAWLVTLQKANVAAAKTVPVPGNAAE